MAILAVLIVVVMLEVYVVIQVAHAIGALDTIALLILVSLAGAWLTKYAGFAVLRRLLQIPREAELVSYSDPKKAMFRYAGIVQGALEACVFFAPPGADFTTEQARRLLGREIAPLDRLALLAGLAAEASPGAGKIVCACFSVSEGTIRAAIHDDQFKTVAELGAALHVGTNCGSCIPELKKLLGAAALSPVA